MLTIKYTTTPVILKRSPISSLLLFGDDKFNDYSGSREVNWVKQSTDPGHWEMELPVQINGRFNWFIYKGHVTLPDDYEPLHLPAKESVRPPAGQNVSYVDWSDPNGKVSKFFIVKEVTQGDKRRIPKAESPEEDNILELAHLLDNLRAQWGGPWGVTSWYRPPSVNREVGGVYNSQHIYGAAADVYPLTGDIYTFQEWLDKRWDRALGYGAIKGFVHLDLRPGRIRWNY